MTSLSAPLLLLLLSLSLHRACSAALSYAFSIDTSGLPLNTVDDHWLGVNIDTGSLYHGLRFDDPALIRLARYLAPAQLRVGGGAADALLFDKDGAYGAGPDVFAATGLNGQVTRLNASAWRALTGFAAATGLSLMWDANGLAFREGVSWGAWNASGTEGGMEPS